jgi:hypothetical protein
MHSVSADKEITMDFVSVRIITDDVARLAGFYERANPPGASRQLTGRYYSPGL